MKVGRFVFGVGIFVILVVINAPAQFRLDQSLLCNKKWVIHASNLIGSYPDLGDAKDYQIYYPDGTGDYRDINTDTLRSKFSWTYKSSTNSLNIVNYSSAKKTHYSIATVLLTADVMVSDRHYNVTPGRTTYDFSMRMYYKRLEDLLGSKAAFESIDTDSDNKRSFRLMQIPETPDKLRVNAYFPRRYSVTNYQIVGSKIYFSTNGAGLLVHDRKNKTWTRMDVSNTPGIPLVIGSLKDDKEGGLWLVSYSLSHLKQDALMHYYIVHKKAVDGMDGGIIGHDSHGNLLFCSDKGTTYTIKIRDLTGLATGVRLINDSSGLHYASRIHDGALADCSQLLHLGRGVATVQNDSLFYVSPFRECSSNEYRIMYEDRNDIMQWGGCQCEIKGKQWEVSFLAGKKRYTPYELQRPFPEWRKGQVNYDSSMKIDGFPMRWEGNRFFSLFGNKEMIDITEQLGIWEYDRETHKHKLSVKYKFASPEEILSDKIKDSNVWLMINHEDMEERFDIFKIKPEPYPSQKWFYGNSSTTKLRMNVDTLQIDMGNKIHYIPIPSKKSNTHNRFDNDAIDFCFPFIWITVGDYLYKYELDKRFRIVRNHQYYLGLSPVYALKQVSNKLLVFTYSGLCVVDLTTLN